MSERRYIYHLDTLNKVVGLVYPSKQTQTPKSRFRQALFGRAFVNQRSFVNRTATREQFLDSGSNTFHWWARSQRIRTFSELEFRVKILS